jgi:hypothetical protein
MWWIGIDPRNLKLAHQGPTLYLGPAALRAQGEKEAAFGQSKKKSPTKWRNDLNALARYCAHGRWMEKTIAQIESEWTTHGNIARLLSALQRETSDGRRTWLEALLKEQRELVNTYEVWTHRRLSGGLRVA